MRWPVGILVLALVGAACVAGHGVVHDRGVAGRGIQPDAGRSVVTAPADEPQVALRVVKWPELAKAIASHKGKVVVVDIWAEY